MPLIELNVEKPSLKRTEIIEAEGSTTTERELDREIDTDYEEEEDTGNRMGLMLGIMLIVAIGLITAWKLRSRDEPSLNEP